jgi:glycosyltransferase involved in cell wall biosynthesis
MEILKNASWINHDLQKVQRLEEISPVVFENIRLALAQKATSSPVVSVIIAAWNEEVNIIRCLDSLSRSQTDIPFEIIVINNNSTDRTQKVVDKIGVPSYIQSMQGVGPSRELGQQMAKGKFILSADADCVYPPRWIDLMAKALMKKGVVFVYGRFSYIADQKHSRWQLFLYEKVRDLLAEIRHLKRPYLNTYGISLGYIRELGIKEGHLNKNIRGFDGRLCFDLMKYGKVTMLRSNAAKAWTGTRAIDRDGSFVDAVTKSTARTGKIW